MDLKIFFFYIRRRRNVNIVQQVHLPSRGVTSGCCESRAERRRKKEKKDMVRAFRMCVYIYACRNNAFKLLSFPKRFLFIIKAIYNIFSIFFPIYNPDNFNIRFRQLFFFSLSLKHPMFNVKTQGLKLGKTL